VAADEAVRTWKEGTILVDVLVAAVVSGEYEGVLERDEEMALWSNFTTVKKPYEVLVPLPKEKPARAAHISITLPDDKQFRSQFMQFQIF